MSENAPMNPELVYAEWSKVGTAVGEAARLYLREAAAYLDWSQNLQREVIDQTWRSARLLSQVGEEQLAFWAGLRQRMPALGAIPNGTETIRGMVNQIVKEAVPDQE
jgi:hypothetical protein